jgi:Fe-S-cluster containining protein
MEVQEVVDLFRETLAEEERLEKWLEGIFSKYCPTCIDPCCNGTKHFIHLEKYESPAPFLKAGVANYSWRKLDKDSVIKWANEFRFGRKAPPIRSKGGSIVPKPSIIEIPDCLPTLVWPKKIPDEPLVRILYVDRYCPFYGVEDKKCAIHDNPKRPSVCREYPIIHVQKEENIYLGIISTCSMHMAAPRIEKNFYKHFPDSIYKFTQDETILWPED